MTLTHLNRLAGMQ